MHGKQNGMTDGLFQEIIWLGFQCFLDGFHYTGFVQVENFVKKRLDPKYASQQGVFSFTTAKLASNERDGTPVTGLG
jgi:hypothetical protein